jgi:hypothetical protein
MYDITEDVILEDVLTKEELDHLLYKVRHINAETSINGICKTKYIEIANVMVSYWSQQTLFRDHRINQFDRKIIERILENNEEEQKNKSYEELEKPQQKEVAKHLESSLFDDKLCLQHLLTKAEIDIIYPNNHYNHILYYTISEMHIFDCEAVARILNFVPRNPEDCVDTYIMRFAHTMSQRAIVYKAGKEI